MAEPKNRPCGSEVGEMDAVVSRAVASLDKVAKWSVPLLATRRTDVGDQGRARRASEVDEYRRVMESLGAVDAKVVTCGGDYLGSTRDRGRRAARRRRPTQPSDTSGQEKGMNPVPDAATNAHRRRDQREATADVSRETWTTGTGGSGSRDDVIDTPIGAEAERAVRLLHDAEARRLPRPASASGSSRSRTRRAAWVRRPRPSTWPPRWRCRGCKVLVIDLDPQGNASTALGIEHRPGTPSSYEVLIGEMPLEAALQRSPHSERLYCVPATIDLAGAEIELVSMVAREGRLRNALADLKQS